MNEVSRLVDFQMQIIAMWRLLKFIRNGNREEMVLVFSYARFSLH